ncbi:MAG: 2,3-bisphosphoglycerate-dependent phosphoglycerate mutase [Betaproteobacteria bacterium]|nr:2,3-bisphosphoglycerate-dependent phosphoglycerate mutase [Betaproteobacteria bacterium]
MRYQLVIMRHGESQWNLENRFTGWMDVPLTAKGIEEARQAGALLRAHGYKVDMAFTSRLRRAIHSLWLVLETMDRMWVPVHSAWQLNESGRQLLISAHGNSIRALLKHLAQISDQEIVELNIPTAQPLWVEFDQDLNYQAHRYLGKVEMTDREIDRATASVAAQGNSDTARIECR